MTRLRDFTGCERLVDIKDIALLKELQVALGVASDGVVGFNTLKAFAAFKKANWLTQLDVLGAGTANLLAAKLAAPLVRKDQVEQVFGRKLSERQFCDLLYCLNTYQINTIPRIRHFLAQVAHESGGLRWLLELASGSAYEGRKDLGNTQKGDGVKFKGAGAIQLTGRANYAKFAESVKDPKVLTLGAKYVAATYPFSSAGSWWSNNRMNALVDSGVGVATITKRVNGGLNGLADRIKYYQKASAAI